MMQLGQQGVNAGNSYAAMQQGAIKSNAVPDLREPCARERLRDMNDRMTNHVSRLNDLIDRVRGPQPVAVDDPQAQSNGIPPLRHSVEDAFRLTMRVGTLLDELEALI